MQFVKKVFLHHLVSKILKKIFFQLSILRIDFIFKVDLS